MKYILNENIALRSWRLVPWAYYRKGIRNASGLNKEEFELLSLCDGQTEIEENELLRSLLQKGFCRIAKEGETLTDWQKIKRCDNRYFPAMNWMITGKCNYNCLHCFNAADNARLQSEFTLEEAYKLIDEAKDCGINAFTITGGEPMLHPNFMDIINRINEKGMFVEELNTNGSFLTQDILNEMKKIGCFPIIKISFDGVGHHDWLRNRKGAEEDALRAIKLCKQTGFSVKAQTNVHRLNVGSMLPTAMMLDSLGVEEMRIIRTTEAPRWVQNAGDACLGLGEYYDRMLEFVSEYIKTDCRMSIDIWQFMSLHPRSKIYRPRGVECAEGEYRDSLPVCRGNRGMVAVGANGYLYPCHQISGYYEQHHDVLGNVKTDGLQKHLQGGDYLCEVCTTVKQLADYNVKCSNCRFFKYCVGGCRAIALVLTGDKLGSDVAKCLFFENGYLEKIEKTMLGYRNTAPVLLSVASPHED